MRKLSFMLFLVIFGLPIVGNILGDTSSRSPYISPNAVEIISKRTEFSKTYDNGNGSSTNEYSVLPLHILDSKNKWQDIDFSKGAKKTALEDSFIYVEYPFPNAWYNSGSSQYGWTTNQYYTNLIGYDSSVGNRRQAFRWDIPDNYDGDISISYLMYTFHHKTASNNLDITTCRMSEDPDNFSNAEDFYTWSDWDCPTNYTSVSYSEIGDGKVYEVDVTEHHYGIEWRINQHYQGGTFFAVLHNIRYEDTSKWSDICASQGEDKKWGGRFYMTYTYQGRKKIASTPIVSTSPNPFNPSTVITFNIDKNSHVSLDVFSINGQKVATLVNGRISSGIHRVVFDGKKLASGLYIYRMKLPEAEYSGKMLLMK